MVLEGTSTPVNGNLGIVQYNNSDYYLSTGAVTTQGNLANGILAQSIGGGGGNGGFSVAGTGSLSMSSLSGSLGLSLGGSGGGGGDGGEVILVSGNDVTTGSLLQTTPGTNGNPATYVTNGFLSCGLEAQSIGGGGGNAGWSVAGTVSVSANSGSASIGANVGGSGGSGGSGGAVLLYSDGAITTYGDSATGILAQSVGGGGNGGWSVSGSIDYGSSTSKSASVAVSVGGSGGSGGSGGTVTLTTGGGVVTTYGDSATGILAQSIGGGGGNGGWSVGGDLTTSGIGLNWNSGGSGGSGCTGGDVTLNHLNPNSSIQTQGYFSPGILAQSIGGGGGNGGASIDSYLGGKFSMAHATGATGGSGNISGNVAVTDSGRSISTTGPASAGIVAQSIGGGGGNGNAVISAGLSATKFTPITSPIGASLATGASGGSGGDAGTVTLTSGSNISTSGAASPGLLAQSIGGGGGTTGFCLRKWLLNDVETEVQTVLSVAVNNGTVNGASGLGNAVSVTTQGTQTISTTGELSSGLIAQSIGGGGGLSWVSVDNIFQITSNGSLTLGGEKCPISDANVVTVTTANQSSLNVSGSGACGIIAQSIGGGGGLGSNDATGTSGTVTIGGSDNTAGDGQTVTVTNGSSINVSGTGGCGIIAQSIGGGGGVGVSNQSGFSGTVTLAGSNYAHGNANTVSVTNTGSISTSAPGGCGIIAQSIGGGGGLFLNTGTDSNAGVTGAMPQGDYTNYGNGGAVLVANSGSISTNGFGAIGIVAQSISGGGGLNMLTGQAGSALGAGSVPGSMDLIQNPSAGPVTVNNTGTINTTGSYAHGIFAQSADWCTGNSVSITNSGTIQVSGTGANAVYAISSGTSSAGQISITNNSSGILTGSSDGTAPICLSGGTNNTVTNAGTITSYGEPVLGTYTNFYQSGTLDSNSLTINSGTFNQTGGATTVTSALTLGGGEYNLSGGNLTTSALNINAGAFNQTGGLLGQIPASHLISDNTGTMNVGQSGATDSSGQYTLTGGNLHMGTLNVNSGGSVTFGATSSSVDKNTLAYVINININSGGSVSTDSDSLLKVENLKINSGGTFTMTGGDLGWSTLVDNGTLIATEGDVIHNGTLTGSGILEGSLINNGTMNPGNCPGTFTIVGKYQQTANGVHDVEVASDSSYDRLNVTGTPGTAGLNGTVAPILYEGYRPRAGQVFSNVISATGGVTGAFSNIAQPLTLSWQTLYNANSVDLLFQPNYANPALDLPSNGLAVGNVLNGVAGTGPTGDMATVLSAIDGLDGAGIRNAYQQISPEKAAALINLGFGAADFQMRNLANRTANLRFLQGESDGGSLNGGGPSLSYSAFNGGSISNPFSGPQETRLPDSRWGLFVDGSGTFGHQSSSANQTGYNYSLGDFTAGADYRPRESLVLGLATGYSNSNATFCGSGGNISTNSIPFNAYVAYMPGSLYAYGALGYTLNLYDLNRGINFNGLTRNASSSTTGNQLNLYGETGYDVKIRSVILTPSATVAFTSLWVDGFTEQGAGALNLKVGSQSATSCQTGLGGRVTVPFDAGSVKVIPQAYAYYQHEFADGSQGLNANLSQDGGAFNFQTDAAQRNYSLVGASLNVGLKKNLMVQVNYNAEVGWSNSTAQNFYAGIRWQF